MSEEFKIEIVNPDKSFLSKEDVTEVIIPAFEGEIGILKDHISIISFLKPGIIKIYSKSGEDKFYVDEEEAIIDKKTFNNGAIPPRYTFKSETGLERDRTSK